MRIFFYTSQIAFGGAERVMSILANHFVADGHFVMFFLGKEHEITYPLDERIVLRFHSNTVSFCKPLTIFKEAKMGRQAMDDFKPDVVITFFSQMAIFAHLAIGRRNISLIYSQRNDPQQDKGHVRLREKFATRWANGIVFQSAAVKELYNKAIKKKSVVITNPFSAKTLPSYELSEANDIVITVGRLAPQKNHVLLIDAFSKIVKTHPSLQLHIYGQGPLKEVLQSKIDSMGLHERVILKGTTNTIWDEMKKARLFVLSSNHEGIPNVLIEAMCMGMPCISTDFSPNGAVEELIANNENGLIISCDDRSALEEAMNHLLDNDNESKRLGDNAKKLIDKVDDSSVYAQWRNLCYNLIKRK